MENNRRFELGAYTFGNTPRTEGGKYGPTAQAIRANLGALKERFAKISMESPVPHDQLPWQP
jgi:hypothetical protein